jgi:hypothetical protein
MQNLIYGLIDPRSSRVRYVGQSSKGMTRPEQHAKPCSLARDRTYKANWLRGLLAAGYEPVIQVLEVVESVEDLNAREIHWIAYGRAIGWHLTNLTDGGEGARGLKHTDEFKAAASARMRGNKWSVGYRHTSAWKSASSTRMLGNKHAAGVVFSPERRAAIANLHRGNTYSVGRKQPAEEIAKRAASLRGKHSNIGRKQPPEEIAKRVASVKAAWANKTPEEMAEHHKNWKAASQGRAGNMDNMRKGWAVAAKARQISADLRRGKPMPEEQRKAIAEGNRRAYAEGRRAPVLAEGQWAKKFDKCTTCETTNHRHKCKGLCTSCWEKTYRTPKRTLARQLERSAEKAR